jgi:hypothetical protein
MMMAARRNHEDGGGKEWDSSRGASLSRIESLLDDHRRTILEVTTEREPSTR